MKNSGYFTAPGLHHRSFGQQYQRISLIYKELAFKKAGI